MSNYPRNMTNLNPGSVPRLILNGIPMASTSSSVFNSPDKSSISELKFRTIQAQQQLVARNLNLMPANDQEVQQRHLQGPASLAMPPPGLIPDNLVRDILALVKKEYPWAEALLASKMSREQFQLLLDKLPELKNIINYRMPVVSPTSGNASAAHAVPHTHPQLPVFNNPQYSQSSGLGAPHFLQEMATAAVAAAEMAQLERDKNKDTDAKRQQRTTMNLIELLLQIKKCAEIGLVDEEIINEPLSPMTLSMINSLILHVKKLAEARRAQLSGALHNPEDELAIRKRLFEMREYIREEQKIYVETLKRRPAEEHQTLGELMKKL